MSSDSPNSKRKKTAVIRARCEETLKLNVEAVACQQNVDPADIIRIACLHYIHRFQGVISSSELQVIQ